MQQHQPDDALEDTAIVSLFLSGRPERQRAAFAALFDRYGTAVYSLAFHVVGEKAIAETVTVEAFFRFWRNSMFWSTSENWSSELLHLAYGLALAAAPDQPQPPAEPDRSNIQPQARNWLPQRVLARLSHTERRVIELAYFLGFTCEEIAAVLGSTPTRVVRDLQMAMRRLHVATVLPERRHNGRHAQEAGD